MSAERFKPYPAYKESGVEWLGEIPAHWTAKRVRQACSRVTDGAHISPDTSSADFPFVSTVDIRGGVIDFDGCLRTSDASYGYMERTGCRPKDGDVLFSKDGTVGTTAVVTTDRAFAVASSLVILSPDKNEVDARWLNHWLNGVFVKEQVELLLSAAALRRISVAKVGRLPVLLPPKLDEQRAIAAFLDRETARIDALVAKKERLIELLQEQRAALITRAATRGLDPNVPMKDSGVEWLGEIPAHWEVRKLKHVCERVFVGIAEAATCAYVDDGVPMLRSTDVRGNRVRTDDIRRIDHRFAERLLSKRLSTGDIVIVRTGNAGVSAVVPAEYNGGQSFTLVVSRPAMGHDSRYFCYWLNAPVGQQQFAIEGMGTAQINISVPIVQERGRLRSALSGAGESGGVPGRRTRTPRRDDCQDSRSRRPPQGTPHRAHLRRGDGKIDARG